MTPIPCYTSFTIDVFEAERAVHLRLNLLIRIHQLFDNRPFLYPNEIGFLETMKEWLKTSDPTPKQLAWIERIERRPR